MFQYGGELPLCYTQHPIRIISMRIFPFVNAFECACRLEYISFRRLTYKYINETHCSVSSSLESCIQMHCARAYMNSHWYLMWFGMHKCFFQQVIGQNCSDDCYVWIKIGLRENEILGRTTKEKWTNVGTKIFQLLPTYAILLRLLKTICCAIIQMKFESKRNNCTFSKSIPFQCFGCWATNKWLQLFHSTFRSFSFYVWVNSSVETLKCITSGDLAHGIGHRKKTYTQKSSNRRNEGAEWLEINKTNNGMKFVVP